MINFTRLSLSFRFFVRTRGEPGNEATVHVLENKTWRYGLSWKSLNKRLTSWCILRLHLPTHWTQFALRSSACVCARLRSSVCLHMSVRVHLRLHVCSCERSTVKSNFQQYLKSNASYWHEIKTIVQPRLLNKTYIVSKNQGRPSRDMLVLSAVGWWTGFQKWSIECQLYFWILKSYKHGTRIGGERDSRPKHITAWT